MERELRLAERRGVLSGASLSPVAELGLEILYALDNQAKQKRDLHEVKLAFLAADIRLVKPLFPEYADIFGVPEDDEETVLEDGTPEAEDALRLGSTEEDLSEVEWTSPSEMDDDGLAEMLRLQQAILASSTQSVQATDGEDWV